MAGYFIFYQSNWTWKRMLFMVSRNG